MQLVKLLKIEWFAESYQNSFAPNMNILVRIRPQLGYLSTLQNVTFSTCKMWIGCLKIDLKHNTYSLKNHNKRLQKRMPTLEVKEIWLQTGNLQFSHWSSVMLLKACLTMAALRPSQILVSSITNVNGTSQGTQSKSFKVMLKEHSYLQLSCS